MVDKQSQVLLTETLILRLLKDLAPDEIVALALQQIAKKYRRFIDAQDSQAISRVDSIGGETASETRIDGDAVSSRDGEGATTTDLPGM